VRSVIAASSLAIGLVLGGCSGDDDQSSAAPAEDTTSTTRVTTAPGITSSIALSGNATVDGDPLDARFLGAVVLRDGFVTPCNVDIPSVARGAYSIGVFGSAQLLGCGEGGARVVLWTYVDDTKLYATKAVPWPSRQDQHADVQFSTTMPNGAVPPVREFSGEVHDAQGRAVAAGAGVEGVIGATVCGIAELRATGYYILSVVGQGTIAGCIDGEEVHFRVDGRFANETSGDASANAHLNLTLPAA
jgi:hypothetical protein